MYSSNFFVHHVMEQSRHRSLINSTYILQYERHGPIIEGSQGVMNEDFLYVPETFKFDYNLRMRTSMASCTNHEDINVAHMGNHPSDLTRSKSL